VEVGSVTLVDGDGPLVVGEGPVRTGVTTVLPRGREGVGVPCAAGWYSLNGNGEMTGTTWIEEVGGLSMPIGITNTHSVGAVHEGVIDWTVRTHPRLGAQWMLPVVAETWDGYLNDINGRHVRPYHAVEAIEAAATGPIRNGSVGGGTGMNCYGFKGGTGTASRVVPYAGTDYTVGVLLQANFGDRAELAVSGVPMGVELADDNPMETGDWFARDLERGGTSGAGSVIVIVATDAPLLPGQCKALARRVPLGLARSGTAGGHFSGDIFLAFSTANAGALRSEIPLAPVRDDAAYDELRHVPWGRIDPFYTAVVEAVDEAVFNALVVNDDMVGRDGHRSPALPHERVVEILRRHSRLAT
jgi:D-aminopeptidase